MEEEQILEEETKPEGRLEDTMTGKTILDVSIVPFEPLTSSGEDVPQRQSRLMKAIMDKIPADNLEEIKKERANRVVTLTAVFYLWKGFPGVTNTRPAKDINNLLKLLLDVIRSGPQGMGLVESDSFVCELYASKQLVDSEQEEGYRIVIEEYEDEPMLNILRAFYSKKRSAEIRA